MPEPTMSELIDEYGLHHRVRRHCGCFLFDGRFLFSPSTNRGRVMGVPERWYDFGSPLRFLERWILRRDRHTREG